MAQVQSYYNLSKIYITQLVNQGLHIAFADSRRKDSQQASQPPLSQAKHNEVYTTKSNIILCFIKGLRLAQNIHQTWLIFNGAIIFWNEYLPVFKNPSNDSHLHPAICPLL